MGTNKLSYRKLSPVKLSIDKLSIDTAAMDKLFNDKFSLDKLSDKLSEVLRIDKLSVSKRSIKKLSISKFTIDKLSDKLSISLDINYDSAKSDDTQSPTKLSKNMAQSRPARRRNENGIKILSGLACHPVNPHWSTLNLPTGTTAIEFSLASISPQILEQIWSYLSTSLSFTLQSSKLT